ncbi:PfkB family carbohydrate kinase, partial [Chryseobacterium sp. SIMBA_028]|uniref:PfkB family carbohydrate kinase n=1 Tax=Chryseobacterium sp. SIMBA_028 TaxID=3085771 RepID=UPI003978651C
MKASDEVRRYITSIDDEREAVASLFTGRINVVVLTKGGEGAAVYLKNGESYEDKGLKAAVSDTAGAGDAFELMSYQRRRCANR